ncbi:IS1182 family transposase [Gammaproteobacteria bacterium 42_54_T18]|nr:IS1182 family transposase [Gammaproteobacteria bacterium 42_54_T18]
MKRFIKEDSRSQNTLFPQSLDDFVSEDNSVRVIDAFVSELDLGKLGFDGVQPKKTGRPGYHPSTLLRIYIYGYLNRIQSSRRLEHETHRNVELMWLTGRLTPDFKTIADFRKDNGEAIRNVCKEFVLLCRRLDLLTHNSVAIDGSKFKAVNSRDQSFSKTKITLMLKEANESIERYMKDLDESDKAEPPVSAVKIDRLKVKLSRLKSWMQRLKAIETELLESPEKQVSLTDPDSRSMKGSRGTMVAYNVQTAVDTVNHLIVAHEVTNSPSDRGQLFTMADKARKVLSAKELTVVADRGYFKGKEILACQNAGITTYLPKPQTSTSKAQGRFGKEDFKYIADDNEYECPAGERLKWRMKTVERGEMVMDSYWSSVCEKCAIKSQCTSGPQRRVKRWESEEVLEELESRLLNNPGKMLRKETVEHPYGTIKMWMGWTHFQMKRLHNVKTEMSLHILAYNMKRVINIIGMKALMHGMQG